MRTILLTLCVLPLGMSAADDVFAGRWKVNPGKSVTGSGDPAPAATLTVSAMPNGYTFTLNNGPASTVLLDGKDHAGVAGRTAEEVGAEKASSRRIEARTIETIYKRGGATVGTIKRQVSGDGSLLTTTVDGLSRTGGRFHNVIVFEKLRSPSGGDEQAILTAHQRFWAGWISEDAVRVAGQLMADDYIDIKFDGTTANKSDELKQLARRKLSAVPEIVWAEKRVRRYGATAVVTGMVAASNVPGVPHLRVTEVWVKQEGTEPWKISTIHSTPIKR